MALLAAATPAAPLPEEATHSDFRHEADAEIGNRNPAMISLFRGSMMLWLVSYLRVCILTLPPPRTAAANPPPPPASDSGALSLAALNQ